MANAFKCDLCNEFREGFPESMPETWAIGPGNDIVVERICLSRAAELRIDLSFEVRVTTHTRKMEVCLPCVNSIVKEGVEKILAFEEAQA